MIRMMSMSDSLSVLERDIRSDCGDNISPSQHHTTFTGPVNTRVSKKHKYQA